MNTDLERTLRDVLAQQQAEVRGPTVAPPDVLRRARRRALRMVVASAIAAFAVIGGAIVGSQALFESNRTIGEDGSAPALPTDGPAPGETSLLLDSGDHDGEPWTLRLTSGSNGGDLVLSFEYERLGGGGAGLAPITGARLFQGMGGSTSASYPDHDPTRPPLPREIAGQVLTEAARVEYQLERGPTVEAKLYSLPEELLGPAKVFLLFVPGETLLMAGDLIAYDASGDELGREYLDMSPVSLYPKVLEESSPEAVAVMKDLQLAGAVVGRYYDTHGSYSGLDPASASAISSEVIFNSSPVAILGEVSIRVDGPRRLVLASATDDGKIYSACMDGSGVGVYGRNDTSDPSACTNGWLDPSGSPIPSNEVSIASGTDPNGNLWSLTLIPTQGPDGTHIELELLLGPIGAYLPLRPLAERDLGTVAAVPPSATPVDAPPVVGLPTSVYGVASDQVARVELRTNAGQTFEGSLYPVPPGSIDAEQVFLFLVPIEGRTIVAFDASGQELQSERVESLG